MVSWGELGRIEPEMAALGAALLEQHGIAYLAPVRRDGAPRVHPVSPFVLKGRLFVSTPRSSPKARDQTRDGRYVLHMLPGKDDAEFLIRGRARLVTDEETRALVSREGPHWARPEDFLFEYDIESAATTWWENVSQPGTRPVRRRWGP
jgi:hypothetical protein